jgi:hypothetical protein
MQRYDDDFYQAALRGYEQSKLEIENKIAELRHLMQQQGPERTPTRRKRVLSATARKRIGDAQKRRWARARQNKDKQPEPAASGSTRRGPSRNA